MKIRSQEKKRTGLLLSLLLLLGTAGSARADRFDDLMTTDDRSGTVHDKSIDAQSRMDIRRDEDREQRDIRLRREAKAAILDQQDRDSRSLYDLFDGAEYGKHSFMDTDFSKHSFVDLSKSKPMGDSRPDDDAGRAKDLFDKSDDDKTADFYRREKAKRDLREKERDTKIWMDLMKPMPDALMDWVPRPADPIHNGGFEREKDNGTPVPYHLNGHPDFERKLPWAEGN